MDDDAEATPHAGGRTHSIFTMSVKPEDIRGGGRGVEEVVHMLLLSFRVPQQHHSREGLARRASRRALRTERQPKHEVELAHAPWLGGSRVWEQRLALRGRHVSTEADSKC